MIWLSKFFFQLKMVGGDTVMCVVHFVWQPVNWGRCFLFFIYFIIISFFFFFDRSYSYLKSYNCFANYYRCRDAFNVKKLKSSAETVIAFRRYCGCVVRFRFGAFIFWCSVKKLINISEKWHVRRFNKYVFCWQSRMAEMVFFFNYSNDCLNVIILKKNHILLRVYVAC